MSQSILTYRWTCPLCSKSKTGISTRDRTTFLNQAKHALLGHVRVTDDEVHGRAQQFPTGFDRDDVFEFIEIKPSDAVGIPTPHRVLSGGVLERVAFDDTEIAVGRTGAVTVKPLKS